jgi:hypothetical protein
MVENTAHSEGRIGCIEGLEVERIETQVLLEFRDAGLTVSPVGIHSGDQFRSNGHGRDEDAVGVARTHDQPPPTGSEPLYQGCAVDKQGGESGTAERTRMPTSTVT